MPVQKLSVAGARADYGVWSGQRHRFAVDLGKRFRLMTPQDHQICDLQVRDADWNGARTVVDGMYKMRLLLYNRSHGKDGGE